MKSTTPSSYLFALTASAALGGYYCMAATAVAAGGNGGGLLIPLYTWPEITAVSGSYECINENYVKVATSPAASKTIAVVNPANGPSWGGDAWMKLSYDTCISYLKQHGVEVIGYVHTKVGYPNISGYRNFNDIQRDIDLWYTSYENIDGIFIDEVTNRWPAPEWDSREIATSTYTNIVDYIRSTDVTARIVLNPGNVYFEDIMAPYYGDSQIISIVFESMQWNFQRDNCIWSLRTDVQGSFDQGPFCNYVPEYDGIEPLMHAMKDDSMMIRQEQSAVLIYGASSTSEDTAESFVHGLAANVGWYYITDRWDWAALPSDVVWDEQTKLAMQL